MSSGNRSSALNGARSETTLGPATATAASRHAATMSMLVTQRDGACVQCGSTHYLSAHHVDPRRDGGRDSLENLVALCARCHGRLEAEQRR